MEWLQWFGLLISLFSFCWIIRQDTLEFRKESTANSARSDKLYSAQAERSDRLYEMFIDLIKECKK